MFYPCEAAYHDSKNAESKFRILFRKFNMRLYDAIKEEIRKSAKKGDFYLYKEKDSLDPDVIELLIQDGYNVSNQYEYTRVLLIFRKKLHVGYMIEWDQVN